MLQIHGQKRKPITLQKQNKGFPQQQILTSLLFFKDNNWETHKIVQELNVGTL